MKSQYIEFTTCEEYEALVEYFVSQGYKDDTLKNICSEMLKTVNDPHSYSNIAYVFHKNDKVLHSNTNRRKNVTSFDGCELHHVKDFLKFNTKNLINQLDQLELKLIKS